MKVKPKKLNHKFLDRRALAIVKKLQQEGFETYLVGGCVRDLLLGLEPKDFDIATTAKPRQVKRLIRNAFIIGRRFRLVLAKEGEDQFEISTFRRNPSPAEQDDPDISDDNLFGTSEQDAQRRDFTINALFYDPIADEIIDHNNNGVQDLKNRKIRMIGDPDVRLVEDPIRILRAVRFAHKTNCEMTHNLKISVSKNSLMLMSAALPRRREELLKFLRQKNPASIFYQLFDLGIIEAMCPSLLPIFENETSDAHLRHIFTQLDYKSRSECEPYELFSALILPLVFTQYPPEEAHQWFKDENNLEILKEELGLFNTEIHVIKQGLKFLPDVLQLRNYLAFSEAQKVDFVNQKGFAEALNYAFLFNLISMSEVSLWSHEYLNKKNNTSDKEPRRKFKKKKRKKKLEA